MTATVAQISQLNDEIANKIKILAPKSLIFTSGRAEITATDIGASYILAVLAWGGSTSLSLGVKLWAQKTYYVLNNTNSTYAGSLDVVIVYTP